IGQAALMALPPQLVMRRASASAAVPWSIRTRFFRRPKSSSASGKADGSRRSARVSRQLRTSLESFRPSIYNDGRPACGMMAKASGSGVCATSAPRMLKAQAIACGSDTTSASAWSLVSSARMRASFSPAASPAKRTSCSATAPSGGAGRSAQMASIRSGSTAMSLAPALLQPLRALDGVQPRIVAEAVVRREVLLDPAIGRHVDQMLDRKQRGIHLLAHLERITPVDEEHGALHQDEGDAGRAGEAR